MITIDPFSFLFAIWVAFCLGMLVALIMVYYWERRRTR